MTQAILWQRVEGLVVLGVSIWLYASLSMGWLWFALLLLTPDIAMIGYWWGNRSGQTIYNLVHTYAWPLLLAGLGYWSGQQNLSALGLIWLAHIGMDRTLGYGLKEAAGFKHTHLGLLGAE